MSHACDVVTLFPQEISMLTAIRTMLAPKAAVRIMICGPVLEKSFHLLVVSRIRLKDVLGVMQVIPNRGLRIELEGSRGKLESLTEDLQRLSERHKMRFFDVAWCTFKNKFETFRVSL